MGDVPMLVADGRPWRSDEVCSAEWDGGDAADGEEGFC